MSSFPFLSKYYLIHPHYRQDHVLFYYLGVFCVESSKLSILGGDGRAVAHHVQPLQVQEIHHLFLLLKIPILSNRHLFSKLLVLHLPIKGKIIFAFSRRHLTGNIHQVPFLWIVMKTLIIKDTIHHLVKPEEILNSFRHPWLLSFKITHVGDASLLCLLCFHCYHLVCIDLLIRKTF